MILRSDKFNDVYFSVDDGMAETHHVFLEGNNLPAAWRGLDRFTIAETGFGTGLNFLCVWKLFEETAQPDQHLHFISVEKYPLSRSDIAQALSIWDDALGDYLKQYLAVYPIRVPGPHEIHMTDRVTLTIWFGDIADVMPEWSGQVDAWFLDGFTPAKNPEMWSDSVFQNMARLSHADTTYATFTAAGFVRQGLLNAGFEVEKVKGYGRKRDMIKGQYTKNEKRKRIANPTIAIIGGGLAGCAMAYMAHRQGLKVTIYEGGDKLATGASGGQKGMVNPKLTAKPSAHSDYYTAAYANALRILADIDDVDFAIHGSKHLCTDADKERRFQGYIDHLGWHSDHIYRDEEGHMIYPDAASVCPEKLCHALAKHADVCLQHSIDNLNDIDADIVVLANGHAVNNLLSDALPVNWVRGQVSWIKPQDTITTNVMYGGYVTPQTPEGFHVLGSTLDPSNDDISLRDDDHQEVLNRYNDKMDQTLGMDDVIGGWAALRTSSKDRFPIVGQVKDNLYISTAHGSHGIISSLYAAEILMADMLQSHSPVAGKARQALSPYRFKG